mmetsp:Transcript_23176/g.30901  ORF Transcript_23176/g.30901 Transcript_23176/m.30901 type:complete len:116 (+) Transcript_23176:2102-2449(+)
MQKLSDLDRKTKHAFMKTQSNVFSTAKLGETQPDGLAMKRKGGATSVKRSSMGGILAHDEGPYSKLDWPSKKQALTSKPSQQNEKQVARQTFIKVMSSKKEPTLTAQDKNKSSVF